jgi:hypothetical protein
VNRFNVLRRLGMAGLAAVVTSALLMAGASGATADTPVPIPASDPIPLPASVTVISMPGYDKPKPHNAHAGAASPAVSFVSIAALPANEPVFGEINLQAQADQDVGPTPWYIMIVDDSNGQVVKSCGTGSQCGLYVESGTAISKNYTAYVGSLATTVGAIQNIQVVSQPQTVSWFHVCG